MCANLRNKSLKYIYIYIYIYSAQHNTMTILCPALFKCENKIKLVENINAQLFSLH